MIYRGQRPAGPSGCWPPVLFFAACLVIFFGVIGAGRVRFRTPEPLRLRYGALQTGARYGPLSSAWSDFEWRKTFDWEAGDTEYRPRPVSQFFEVLTPRIHVQLWDWFGPFLWYPFDLFLTLLIGAVIALIVRALTGNIWAGLVGGAFWLVTVEVLVGFYFPVRPTKSLVTLEFLLGLLALLRLRDFSPRQRPFWAAAFGAVTFLGFFTDEYGYLAAGVYLFLLVFHPRLRRWRLPLGAAALALLVLAAAVIFFWLPRLGYNQERPPFAFSKGRETLSGLVSRNLDYGWKNSLHVLKCFSGWVGAFELSARLALGAALAVLGWVFFRARAWRGLLWPALTALAMGSLAGFVLLPAGTDILYQYTYYNRPLTALLCVLVGCSSACVLESGSSRSYLWLAVLLVPALFSARYSHFEINQVEENDLGPYGVDNILGLPGRLRSGELKTPVYLAYPRARDLSRGAWDELRYRGWWTREEEPFWLLYRYLTPMLYLKRFEDGTLLADPVEFKVWARISEAGYMDRAVTYYDLLRDKIWELGPLKRESFGPVNWGEGAQAISPGFWGFRDKVQLAPGRWEAAPWSGTVQSEDGLLVAVIRGANRLRVHRGGREIVPWRRMFYDWAYELIILKIGKYGSGQSLSLEIDAAKEAEILGPAVLPAENIVPATHYRSSGEN